MLGIGSAELMVILVIAFFVVGPQKLPDVARMIARMFRFVKKNMDEINESISRDIEEEDFAGEKKSLPDAGPEKRQDADG